ncbi:hypothetical protein TRFO_35087 [Tritrichomonas foetus]|uniref:Mitochondrial carrier protein n=1 Tax=Tritrichomonas foetus TaxID=1144522 RepID=A0A1J4JLM8_9EUKA|nr:hypothetical protein TRFO_35087 [Tritrichomonas foetus]|eukprot:OHS98467.1 hypothetical protein TRFO_35087 [Tritrichomonas foetus]
MARIADAVLYATSPALLPDVRLNCHDNFVCGLVSGVMARSITSPIDVVRLLTQVSSGEKSTDFVRQIYKRDGIRGFWQGNFISVVNQGLYSGIKFLLLKELVSCRKFLFKSCCNSTNDGDSKGNKIICCTKPEFSQLEAAVAGGVSGVIAQTIVFPLDFLRTRMIVNPYKYTSIFQAIERIYQEEGIHAFWSGLLPTIAGSIPYESSQYLIYGQLIHTFDEQLTPPPKHNCRNARWNGVCHDSLPV